jgi:hypothetical protein
LWDRPIIATAITYDTAINDPRTKAAARLKIGKTALYEALKAE